MPAPRRDQCRSRRLGLRAALAALVFLAGTLVSLRSSSIGDYLNGKFGNWQTIVGLLLVAAVLDLLLIRRGEAVRIVRVLRRSSKRRVRLMNRARSRRPTRFGQRGKIDAESARSDSASVRSRSSVSNLACQRNAARTKRSSRSCAISSSRPSASRSGRLFPVCALTSRAFDSACRRLPRSSARRNSAEGLPATPTERMFSYGLTPTCSRRRSLSERSSCGAGESDGQVRQLDLPAPL